MLKFLRQGTPEPLTDDQLLERYLSGSGERYIGILYERYMAMVYGVCLKILRDPGKAEDAVIGIYEELSRKIKEHEVASFRGWLYVMARNYCLMEWRKQQRRPVDFHAPEDMVHYDAIEPTFEIEMPSMPSSLEKCLAELPQHQRKTVELFYYEDKSYKEIADLVREEIGKVRSYIQNGKRNLKLCLDKVKTEN